MKIHKLFLIGSLLFSYWGATAQSESSVMQTGKKYYIQSAMNYGKNYGGYWDIPGSPLTVPVGSKLAVWDLDGGTDRMYTLVESNVEGFYEMYVSDQSNTRVGVEGYRSENGTKITIKEKSGHASEKFYFIHKGNGKFRIYGWDSKPICLDGRKNANGNGLVIWDDHEGDWMDWYLIDASTKTAFLPAEVQPLNNLPLKGDQVPLGQNFYIQSAMSYGKSNNGYWDLPGNNKVTIGDKIQIWTLDGGTDRLFRFEKKRYGEYLQIYCGNTIDGVVDIPEGKTDNGNKATIWSRNHGAAQDFYLKHLGNGRYKIYHRSGKILCIAGVTNDNGTAVHLWDDHNGNHLEWYLIDAKTRKAYIPGGSTSSTKPDFFINNKYFKYKSGTMVGHSEGNGSVEKIEGNKISVKIEGTNYCSDVPPGQPTETTFSHVIIITYENGKYIYDPQVFSPGELSDSDKKLSFSGDAYVELIVSKPPVPLKGWIEAHNDYSLEEYMQKVSLNDIKGDDSNIIATSTSSLSADGQIKVVMGFLNGAVRNKDAKARDYIYTELGKVNYKKASGILRMSMTAYMNNTVSKEPVPELRTKIETIQQKINSAR